MSSLNETERNAAGFGVFALVGVVVYGRERKRRKVSRRGQKCPCRSSLVTAFYLFIMLSDTRYQAYFCRSCKYVFGLTARRFDGRYEERTSGRSERKRKEGAQKGETRRRSRRRNGRAGVFVAKRARLRREAEKNKKKGRFTGDPFLFFAKTPSENRRFPLPGAAESDLVRVL